MDKQEYYDIVDGIKHCYEEEDYEGVIDYSRDLDLNKVRDNMLLEMVSDAYEKEGRYEIARDVLLIAYEKTPMGRKIAYRLSELCLQLDDLDNAVGFYNDFCKMSPNDNRKYLLKYEIARAGKVPAKDLIKILETYNSREMDERWQYELARLYHEAGMADKCVETCDDIILWYSDGEYVKKALELKFAHKALSPSQQAKYESMMSQYLDEAPEPVEEEKVPEEDEFLDQSAEDFADDFLGGGNVKTTDPFASEIKVTVPDKPLKKTTEDQSAKSIGKKGEFFFDMTAEMAPAGVSVRAEEEPDDFLTEETAEEAAEAPKEIHAEHPAEGMAEPDEDPADFLTEEPEKIEKPEIIVTPVPTGVGPQPETVLDYAKTQQSVALSAASAGKIGKTVSVLSAAAGRVVIPGVNGKKITSEQVVLRGQAIQQAQEAQQEDVRPEVKTVEPAVESTETEQESVPEEGDAGTLVVAGAAAAGAGISLAVAGAAAADSIEGQMNLDDVFSSYAKKIEENQNAVARVEAERLRQIRAAVEQSMPAAPVIEDFDEEEKEDDIFEEETVEKQEEDFIEEEDYLEEEPVEELKDDFFEEEPEDMTLPETVVAGASVIPAFDPEDYADAEVELADFEPDEDAPYQQQKEEPAEEETIPEETEETQEAETETPEEEATETAAAETTDAADAAVAAFLAAHVAEALDEKDDAEEELFGEDNFPADELFGDAFADDSGEEESAKDADSDYKEYDNTEEYIEEEFTEEEYTGYELSDEQRSELSEFLMIGGMEERICRTIEDIISDKLNGDPTGGNLIVAGDSKTGKTFLTIAIIKAVGREVEGSAGRVAKVQAASLNGKNIEKVLQRVEGSDLIIENVGFLDDETLEQLIDCIANGKSSSLISIEGNLLAIDNILNNYPEMKDLFRNRIDISELSLSQWAKIACEYAEEQGYTISDMAMLALHAKIDERNVANMRFGIQDVEDIVDDAIDNAEKRSTGHLFSAFRKKSKNVELEEEDFE